MIPARPTRHDQYHARAPRRLAYVGLTDAVAAVTTTPAGARHHPLRRDGPDGTELLEYDAVTQVPDYLGRDAHGDTVWTAGANGAPTSSGAYDPFGNLSGSIATVTRWQGTFQDASTGLYFVVARWYDPVSGAFLSEDPVPGNQKHPQSLDSYAYGAGDPIGSTDRTGLASDGVHWVAGWQRVAEFHEPASQGEDADGNRRDPHNAQICVAGALRVVLAFTSHSPKWRVKVLPNGFSVHYWPKSKYPDDPYTARVDSGDIGRDTYGQGYLLYLAYGATEWPGSKGRNTYQWGQTNAVVARPAALLANWETLGEPDSLPAKANRPFASVATANAGKSERSTFLSRLRTSIDHDVPVFVAADRPEPRPQGWHAELVERPVSPVLVPVRPRLQHVMQEPPRDRSHRLSRIRLIHGALLRRHLHIGQVPWCQGHVSGQGTARRHSVPECQGTERLRSRVEDPCAWNVEVDDEVPHRRVHVLQGRLRQVSPRAMVTNLPGECVRRSQLPGGTL